MLLFLRNANFRKTLHLVPSPSLQNVSANLPRFFHLDSNNYCSPQNPLSSVRPNTEQTVGIFWDLDNKPPKNFPPYDAAVRLKLAASAFGNVKYTFAYANHHAFAFVPPLIRQQRKDRKTLDCLESKGVIKPPVPYLCRVCGRKFYTNDKLINHFKQLHEREQQKRLNRLESARGKRRVQLAAKFSMKMHKYKNAARDVLTPKVGYGLADELKRAGFWVRTVPDKPQAADAALRNHMVEMMDRRMVGCLMVVSDDTDFVGVLREAKLRCVKTIVVGDNDSGVLRRSADAGFSWKEIVLGKAKKEAVSVVGRWKDREILKKLEWTYRPVEESELESEDFKTEDDSEVEESLEQEDSARWWELESDQN